MQPEEGSLEGNLDTFTVTVSVWILNPYCFKNRHKGTQYIRAATNDYNKSAGPFFN